MSKTMIFYFILDIVNHIAIYEEENGKSECFSDYKSGIAQGKRSDVHRLCCYAGWDTQTVTSTIKKLGNKKILNMKMEEVKKLVEKF